MFLMISRSGVNDWERGSMTKWKHRMNLPSDNFFGTCKTLQIARENVLATNMSVEFLGYSSSDNINVKSVFISLSSPTWISQPLEFQAKDIGWTSTNLQTYAEGGLHLIAPLTLKDPGFALDMILVILFAEYLEFRLFRQLYPFCSLG